MRHREYTWWVGIALGVVVSLSGCGGLEKGPAPALPYTPEPPAPKTEKKADVPKIPGPSTSVPIKAAPLTTDEKTDEGKVQPPAPDAKKVDVPAPDTKKADTPVPDAKKADAPATETKK